MFNRFLVHCLTPVLLCSSCLVPADVDSTDIRTSGLYAHFEASSEGTGTVVMTGRLYVGGAVGTLVELKGEDQLWAQVGAVTRRFSGGDGGYSVRLDDDGDGTEIVVSLTRGNGDEGAPESRIRLPRAFEPSLKGLPRGDSLARGKSLTVRWSPAGAGTGVMGYSISGNCIFPKMGQTSDDGEMVISSAEITALKTARGRSCDVVVEMGRDSSGSVDPNFGEGGIFRAYQIRRINFTSTPAPDEMLPPDSDQGGAPNAGPESDLGGAES